ncbi:MAG TPA: YncE family protein [Bryobacteraceae bacterium]
MLRLIFAVSLTATLLSAASSYKLVKTIPVGGSGGWDYLAADAHHRRLYVSHRTEVDVLNLDTNKLVGKIPDTDGVHGIAIARRLNRGFVSDGLANQVTIFNLKTLATLSTVKTGRDPDAIVYDPFTRRVFTFNGRSQDMTAIDAVSGRAIRTVALGGKPEFAVTDGHGNLYDNLEDKSELIRIDPKTLQIEDRWPLAPCQSPSGLAIDVQHHRLFSVCRNSVMAVVDTDTGKVIAHLPTGPGTDAARFDAARKLAFASNGGNGTLTVIGEQSPNRFSVLENVRTERGARTMALDTKTNRIYLSDARFAPAPAGQRGGHHRHAIVPGTFKLLVVAPQR